MRISRTLFLLLMFFIGCSGQKQDAGQTGAASPTVSEVSVSEIVTNEKPESPQLPAEDNPEELPVIAIGGGMPSAPLATAQAQPATATSPDTTAVVKQNTETVIEQLHGLQILLGTWRGITQKQYGGNKAVDQTEWVWDFQTAPEQPALVMDSAKSPHYREARLTYLPDQKQYQMTLTDAEGRKSVYQGQFTAEIANDQGEDGKPQRTYKLELTQTDAKENEAGRLVFNQQDNNRYLLEIYRQRGNNDRFLRVDTVSTQREGTSLAASDEDYGDKTCIISGGLGTITVSYQGQSYYVCCTGCQAAFNDDPARWIARFQEQKQEQQKK